MPEDSDDARRRNERRAWILAHHPDRGGDPDAFAAGLARWASSEPAPAHRISVHRSTNPLRRVQRWARRRGKPPRHLL